MRKRYSHVSVFNVEQLHFSACGDMIAIRTGSGFVVHVANLGGGDDGTLVYQAMIDAMNVGRVVNGGVETAVGFYDPSTGLAEIGAASGAGGRAAFELYDIPVSAVVNLDDLGSPLDGRDVAERCLAAVSV